MLMASNPLLAKRKVGVKIDFPFHCICAIAVSLYRVHPITSPP